MGVPRQEYWSGLQFLPPGDLPPPRTERASPVVPALTGAFFTTELPGKPPRALILCQKNFKKELFFSGRTLTDNSFRGGGNDLVKEMSHDS